MGEILSLSKARKEKARADKEITAATNRAKHGRTRAEKSKQDAERSLANKIADAHRREPK